MSETVTFNANDLASVQGLTVVGTDPHRPTVRDLNTSPIARNDKSIVTSAFYPSRKIHVLATLARSNKADMQTGLRKLEALLQPIEALLVFSVGGISTEFTATKANISADFYGGMADLDIEFFCSNPTGYAVSSTTLYNYASLVGSSYSFAVTWSGNVNQQPVITITFTSLTGGTTKAVTIGNSTTTEAVVITRTWSNGDVLVVNSKTKTVTVNGSAVAYTGSIPEWTATQPITYADTLTTRNIAVNLAYQIRNL